MLSRFSRVQLFGTPWTAAHQAPLSMGISRQKHPSGLLCPLPGDLPDPGVELASLMSPALAGGFFAISTTWEAGPVSHTGIDLISTYEPSHRYWVPHRYSTGAENPRLEPAL